MLLEQLALFRFPPQSAAPKTRQLLIGPTIVPYVLNQRARRRLTLTIDERGLRVGAPLGISLTEIEAFVRQHGDWVLAKLSELASHSRPRHLSIRDGTRLPLLGKDIEIRVLPGANRSRWIGDTLLLEARGDADLGQQARRAMQRRALGHFDERLNYFAPQMGVALPRIGLSSARTRWGSCSSASGIRINWRLIHLPPQLGDYVAVHELAHLIEMNHSPRFWSVVSAVYPDWKSSRAELKAAATTLPVF
jgi:predicted metal-dependent hydrolase